MRSFTPLTTASPAQIGRFLRQALRLLSSEATYLLPRQRVCLCPLIRGNLKLLAFYLPRRPRSEAEVLRQMQKRHAARQRDLDNRRRRQRRNRKKSELRD